MIFEHKTEPLLSGAQFFRRMLLYSAFAIALITGSLAIGVLGYHQLEKMSLIDALLNSAMLLGGMGPINPLNTDAGKLFASLYALFSGMVFLGVAGLFFAPIYHRFLHHFHLELD